MGYIIYVFHGSTLVAARELPLINALTGEPGRAFPHLRLRSGIIRSRVTAAFHRVAASLRSLLRMRVFITAFGALNVSQNRCLVNDFSGLYTKNHKNDPEIRLRIRKNDAN